MGQKSIGAFIAALRKANGMTQKDLADRLNVSDKTVSRWERDEGAPDLSLIPVIAEIFGVTCDELLRGERRAPEERADEAEAEGESATARGQKQRQRLLAAGLTRYKNHTYIAMGVSLAGLAAAMILNLGFLYAIIGFSVAMIFLIAGVVCQLIFINNAFAAVAGIDEGKDLYNYKRSVVRLGEYSFGLDVFLLGVALPLLFVAAYLGLSAASWLAYGLLAAAVLTVVYVVICWAVNASLVKKGVLRMDEAAEACYWKKHRLQRKYGVRLCVALVITLAAQIGVNAVDATVFTSGTLFEDYNSFVAYIEEVVSRDTDYYGTEAVAVVSEPEEEAVLIYQAFTEDWESLYFDENGSPVSESYVNSLSNVTYGDALVDGEGNLLCKWVWRNRSVSCIRYGGESSGYLPIVTYDDEALAHADFVIFWLNILFVAAYVAETVVTVVVYRKQRKG
ncbi:MAG: helix-turn-helix domain-containing protein [Oscillospiraceae bacterium]|nr:helix-turn-helix domain-containing protein [Oscillospiraceae bacterium]